MYVEYIINESLLPSPTPALSKWMISCSMRGEQATCYNKSQTATRRLRNRAQILCWGLAPCARRRLRKFGQWAVTKFIWTALAFCFHTFVHQTAHQRARKLNERAHTSYETAAGDHIAQYGLAPVDARQTMIVYAIAITLTTKLSRNNNMHQHSRSGGAPLGNYKVPDIVEKGSPPPICERCLGEKGLSW